MFAVHNAGGPRLIPEKMSLDSLCTYDQALLEGGVGGACLQRNHVPPPHLPHHPNVGGISYQYIRYAVSVRSAGAVLEHHLISPPQLIEVVEDHAAPGSPKAHAVSCQVDVPLGSG